MPLQELNTLSVMDNFWPLYINTCLVALATEDKIKGKQLIHVCIKNNINNNSNNNNNNDNNNNNNTNNNSNH